MLQPTSCCWPREWRELQHAGRKDSFCCEFKNCQAAEWAPPIAGMWDWQPGQTCKWLHETHCSEWAAAVGLCLPTWMAARTILELTSVKLPTMTRQMATMKGRRFCFHMWDLSVTFSAWWQTHGSRAWTLLDLYGVFGTLGHVWWLSGCQLQPHHSQMT